MQIITVKGGTFIVNGQRLANRAALRDNNKPGVYNLVRRGNKWELYYTASGSSQPTRITDGRFKAAIQALLDWHKAKLNCNNCVELAPGQWHLCEEAQELLVGGSEENAKDSVIRESPTPSAGFDLAGLLYARDDWSGRGGRSHGWPAWFSLGSHNILLLAWNPKV